MPRSFRFQPPSPRLPSLTRPRLLRALLGRWEHRVTSVIGGAGLGKTTLLAQAIGENRLAPRGDDVWIGVEPGDSDGDALARDALAALHDAGPAGGGHRARTADAAPRPEAVADAVWRRSPTAVCLVFDDVHLLPAGSPGAAWLAALVDALPSNGHVLLAGRTDPPLPLARLLAHGDLLQVGNDDLRFTEEEVASFAADRGIDDVGSLGSAGGWPAMTELAASVPGHRADDYLWEEVLAPLGDARRRVLAVVADLGGADDELAAAVLDEPVDLGVVLDGVPLVASDDRGWRVPHPLWRTVPALALAEDDRRQVRRRSVAHHLAAGRFDDALALAVDTGLDDVVPGILRAACLGPGRPPAARLARWLEEMPPSAAGTSGAALAAGLHSALVSPGDAIEPLRAAWDLFRADGDVDGELATIALLGRVTWWLARLDVLGELLPRVLELEAEGHPLARALAGIGRAVVADLDGDDATVIAVLEGIEPGALDPGWAAVADWLRASTLASSGRALEALAVLDAMPPTSDPAFAATSEGGRLTALWALGDVDTVAEEMPGLLDRVREAGLAQNRLVGLAQAVVVWSTLGEIETAAAHLDEARLAEREAGAGSTARMALAEATLRAASGDEATAITLLEDAIARHGLGDGSDRRPWRVALPLTYILVPNSRASWDDAELAGHVDDARALARAVVRLRAGDARAVPTLAARGVPPVNVIRTALATALRRRAGRRPPRGRLARGSRPPRRAGRQRPDRRPGPGRQGRTRRPRGARAAGRGPGTAPAPLGGRCPGTPRGDGRRPPPHRGAAPRAGAGAAVLPRGPPHHEPSGGDGRPLARPRRAGGRQQLPGHAQLPPGGARTVAGPGRALVLRPHRRGCGHRRRPPLAAGRRRELRRPRAPRLPG